jgi:hypothetical protein
MIQIRFKASGANSMLGSFASGDIARVSETFARHLVEEARVAEYIVATTASAANPEKPAKAPRRKPKE